MYSSKTFLKILKKFIKKFEKQILKFLKFFQNLNFMKFQKIC